MVTAAQSFEVPNSAECERTILGVVIVNPELATKVSTLLLASDFYTPSHRSVFNALREILNSGAVELRAPLIAERLRAPGVLEQVGGIPGILYLAVGVPGLLD